MDENNLEGLSSLTDGASAQKLAKLKSEISQISHTLNELGMNTEEIVGLIKELSSALTATGKAGNSYEGVMTSISDAMKNWKSNMDVVEKISSIISAVKKFSTVQEAAKAVTITSTIATEASAVAVGAGAAVSEASAVATGVAAAATEASTVVTQTATVAQTGLNTAMKANPIMLVVSGLIALLPLLVSFIGSADKAADTVDDTAESADKASDSLSQMREEMEQLEESRKSSLQDSETEIAILQAKAAQYEKLRTKTNKVAEDYNVLNNLAKDIEEASSGQISLIGEQTNQYYALGGALDSVIEKLRIKAQLDAGYEEYGTALVNIKALQEKRAEYYLQEPVSKPDFLTDEDSSQSILNKDYSPFSVIQNINGKLSGFGTRKYEDIDGSTESSSSADNSTAVADITEMNQQLADYEKYIADYEDLQRQYYQMTDDGGGSGNKGNGDNKTAAEKALDAFKEELEGKKYLLDMDEITEAQYYESLEQLLSKYHAESSSEFNSYRVELHNYQKQAAEEAVELEKKAAQEKLDAQKAYYEEAREAYEELVNARIAAVDEELEAEQKLLNAKLKAIDEEIEARKELREDRDLQEEVDAVTAKLKYSQLDSFSRMELEKQLAGLREEQEEISWQRQKEAEREAAQAEYEAAQAAAEAEKKELQEKLAYSADFFDSLINGKSPGTSTSTTNNNTKANINIISSFLSNDQIARKVVEYLQDGVF